jgi:alpha-1,4-digalacturonate transport system permease protein
MSTHDRPVYGCGAVDLPPLRPEIRSNGMTSSRDLHPRTAPFLFLGANLLVFTIFTIIPAIYNFYLSLFRTSAGGTPLFVGLGNFRYLVNQDDIFWRALVNTGLFVVGDVSLILLFSVAIALLLNQPILFRGFFRGVFFYPVLLSPVVVALVWRWALDTNYGLLNGVLRLLGVPPQPWLLRADYALSWIVIIHVWATVGLYALIVLAGLQSIPSMLYDAAVVDGAGRWESFVSVTLPLLRPTIFAVLILSLIKAFEVFEFIYVLTGGGPGFGTLTVVQYVFREGFGLDQLGLASAASVLLFLIILILTVLQYAVGRFMEAV